ncbi:MAG: extracellular solute-binding protein [Phycisphaerales bacterium JB039]
MIGLLMAALLGACGERGPAPVTLYSSVDGEFLREVVAEYERRTGVRVNIIGDTEATKTTGLVERVLAERVRPRGDVWWSSEALGSARLASEGALEPVELDEAALGFPDGWPEHLRAPDRSWRGFAARARVICFNTERVRPEDVPRDLAELTDPKWRGRVGLARPQFGTTRTHMAALVGAHGAEAFEAWLRAMEANGMRLFDGNSTVVRAVAQGQIDLCLTDTDDVWAGQRNGWPVDLVYEAPHGAISRGALLIPNTAGLIAGAPNRAGGLDLLRFILSPDVERMLAESDSHNAPVRPGLAAEYGRWAIPDPWLVEVAAIEASAPQAMAICDEVLP